MKLIRLCLLLGCLCIAPKAIAQLSTNEKPISFTMDSKQSDGFRDKIPTVTMPRLDMAKIEAEDKEDEKYDVPPRFGYPHRVNYNLNNSGVWHELPNGDRLWQLNVVCPEAKSVNFLYDKFWIPEGGKLFIYTKDHKHAIGAFTARNNKGTREELRGFATGLLYGNDVILEYYQPKEVSAEAEMSVEYVVHGYREFNPFGNSGSCHVNVNCSEGQNWQNEKNAVTRFIINGSRYGSGSLINSTDLDAKPYLLTANHIIGARLEDNIFYDAETAPNIDYSLFCWAYEAPGCDNVSEEPYYYTTSGATVVANNVDTDFALFRLDEDPIDVQGYTPYYLGWDCSGSAGLPGVCIHHPMGDIKKISTVISQPSSTAYTNTLVDIEATHWMVAWKWTENGHGTTEGGSSGSPLLNNVHKVIGLLHGGYSSCYNKYSPDWFGKISASWTGNGNNSIYRRLNCWLDSLGTGQQTLKGLLVVKSAKTLNVADTLYNNLCVANGGQLTAQNDMDMTNCSVIVDAGGRLIVNGATLTNMNLVLKPGGALQIVNGGVISTTNGFEAPLGVTVDVENGQIL